ncbi:MAG: hypothetical protein ISS48_00035 [Candidatus Aenigmarchaeota archaeon]|nr:hypothetical protein [Candidatus Aenigmarchaeota archaeon]
MRKGLAEETTFKLVLGVIVLIGITYLFWSYAPDIMAFIQGQLEDLFEISQAKETAKKNLKAAIMCSYYRCKEGCDSKTVKLLEWTDSEGEKSCLEDFCTDKQDLDKDGKICDNDAKIHPVTLTLEYPVSLKREDIELEKGEETWLAISSTECNIDSITRNHPQVWISKELLKDKDENSCQEIKDFWVSECDIAAGDYFISSEKAGYPSTSLCDHKQVEKVEPPEHCQFQEPNLCGEQPCKGNPFDPDVGVKYSNICCELGEEHIYNNGPDPEVPCFSTDDIPYTLDSFGKLVFSDDFTAWYVGRSGPSENLKNMLIYWVDREFTDNYAVLYSDEPCKTGDCTHAVCQEHPTEEISYCYLPDVERYYSSYVFFKLTESGGRSVYGIKLVASSELVKGEQSVIDVYLYKLGEGWILAKEVIIEGEEEGGSRVAKEFNIRPDGWSWDNVDSIMLGVSDKSTKIGLYYELPLSVHIHYIGLLTKSEDDIPFCTQKPDSAPDDDFYGVVDNGEKCYYNVECPSASTGWRVGGVSTLVSVDDKAVCDCEESGTCGRGYCQNTKIVGGKSYKECYYGVNCTNEGWIGEREERDCEDYELCSHKGCCIPDGSLAECEGNDDCCSGNCEGEKCKSLPIATTTTTTIEPTPEISGEQLSIELKQHKDCLSKFCEGVCSGPDFKLCEDYGRIMPCPLCEKYIDIEIEHDTLIEYDQFLGFSSLKNVDGCGASPTISIDSIFISKRLAEMKDESICEDNFSENHCCIRTYAGGITYITKCYFKKGTKMKIVAKDMSDISPNSEIHLCRYDEYLGS